MPHHHLSLQSLNSFQSNTDNDDHRSATDCQSLCSLDENVANHGQQSYNRQINSTEYQNLADNLLDKISGGLAGTEAGNETAVFLQVVLFHHPV